MESQYLREPVFDFCQFLSNLQILGLTSSVVRTRWAIARTLGWFAIVPVVHFMFGHQLPCWGGFGGQKGLGTGSGTTGEGPGPGTVRRHLPRPCGAGHHPSVGRMFLFVVQDPKRLALHTHTPITTIIYMGLLSLVPYTIYIRQ